jgi:hypothetical protein
MESGEDMHAAAIDAERSRREAARASAEAHRVRRALLALESPASLDFDDPTLEWRRLFSEILGTFLLVMAGAGAVVVSAVSGGAISRTAAVTAPGRRSPRRASPSWRSSSSWAACPART